jgi:hypothetical protein
VCILGDRLDGDAADAAERFDADDGVRAAPERGLPAVLAGLDRPVEQSLLAERDVPAPAPEPRAVATVLKRIQVVEVLRCLDDRNRGIGEVAERVAEKSRSDDVIRIEHADHVEVEARERVVEIARFGVATVLASHIVRAE